jgi:glycosyltransferase involved in cell wall biosynthesis
LPESKPTVVFISTYPPRECGIATFTQDLFKYCQKILGPGIRCKIAAMNVSPLDTYNYPPEVSWEIDQDSHGDYVKLADAVNEDKNITGVILQHEYGIFGGVDGEKILIFMKRCRKPVLVTLHTALPSPTLKMLEVTAGIIKYASNIVVLTKKSKEIIEHLYPKSCGKIFIIPHGVHGVEFSDQRAFKSKLELSGHFILSTFGLLSRGKGIEYVLHALPDIIRQYPNVLYLVLGQTHPIVRRNEGEKYRLELAHLVVTLGLEKHVKFYDQYFKLPDLLQYLQATDIYISTSINPNQAVSGTLSYALGTGRTVISTEFAQAKEVITPRIGRLVPIQDSPAITDALSELLHDKQKLSQMARNAYDETRTMLWSNVAVKYTNLLERTIIPPVNLKHLYTMTDHTGLIQFAKFNVPDVDSGYTLDDNVRALVSCSWMVDTAESKKMQVLIRVFLAFIEKCQQEDGSFVNYIGYTDKLPTSQNFREDLEDTQARTMWGLAEVMSNLRLPEQIRKSARSVYLRSLPKGSGLMHLRAKAFAIKSFATAMNHIPSQKRELLGYMKTYADSLLEHLRDNSSKSWVWFEKDLNYSNALLSESLLIAGNCLDNSSYSEKGARALQFLIGKTFSPDMYMPIGHSKWYTNKERRSQYDQQPEDPASMITALTTAYGFTNNEEYKNLAKKCFSWFLGNNSLNKPLYDLQTGGCCDGLHPDRVNLNQGAESLVSYLMSNHMVTQLQ